MKIIAALRSEVLTAVESSGKEINKIVSDFAIPIMWHQSGGNISNHPILQIIIKRIKASEKFYSLNLDDSPEAIWSRYFPQTIQNESTQKYILHLTWYRPRDVIRLLNLARNQYPKSTKFTHQVFDGIRKSYSSESWNELSEELRAIYREDEIDGIKRIFY
ncbi:P-loop ATPase, Sll1717 family, partial [Bacillus atrophaeus]|uniref:P-loop ATPase, Sll1717 family n=1 Tax=Bacillus atrophaeus TaxID=1452 RepID=UPI0039905340